MLEIVLQSSLLIAILIALRPLLKRWMSARAVCAVAVACAADAGPNIASEPSELIERGSARRRARAGCRSESRISANGNCCTGVRAGRRRYCCKRTAHCRHERADCNDRGYGYDGIGGVVLDLVGRRGAFVYIHDHCQFGSAPQNA